MHTISCTTSYLCLFLSWRAKFRQQKKLPIGRKCQPPNEWATNKIELGLESPCTHNTRQFEQAPGRNSCTKTGPKSVLHSTAATGTLIGDRLQSFMSVDTLMNNLRCTTRIAFTYGGMSSFITSQNENWQILKPKLRRARPLWPGWSDVAAGQLVTGRPN